MHKIGIIGTSNKQNERRIPIHPDHLSRLPEVVRRQLIFEENYGKPFNISNEVIASQTCGKTMKREDLLAEIGNVILAKPVLADLQNLKI